MCAYFKQILNVWRIDCRPTLDFQRSVGVRIVGVSTSYDRRKASPKEIKQRELLSDRLKTRQPRVIDITEMGIPSYAEDRLCDKCGAPTYMQLRFCDACIAMQ